ncbi:MAG: right handed beta helix region family protein [Actinomycetia bacterium]|nr:right handed beta helix region family protein [Actinomycetes bacterium]
MLHSPYTYNGPAVAYTHDSASGTYSSGTWSSNGVSVTTTGLAGIPSGLPTFGAAGTDYPAQTSLVAIPAGDNATLAGNATYAVANTVYYWEPGEHSIRGMYTGDDSVYIGGYGGALSAYQEATIDGGGTSQNFLSQTYNSDQVWKYVTIQNFGSTHNGGVLGNAGTAGHAGNTDEGNTYMYDTIGPNEYGLGRQGASAGTAGAQAPGGNGTVYGESNGGGYAIDMGSNTTVEYNCITQDAQGAFNGTGVNIDISHNEISRNGLGSYPDDGGTGGSPYGCGCSGGGKLFFSLNAVIDYNYVHDNYNAGIWLDFDNDGADISHNYIASNWAQGIFYEASYNANITDNTLTGNGWASDGTWPAGVGGGTCYSGVSCTNGLGPATGAGGGNPYAAIDLSNSGGNPNLTTVDIPADIHMPGCASNCSEQSNYRGQLLVENNDLIDNFGGVKVYTDTNRFPGNIDNDSACSIPLGPLTQSNNTTYYLQTKLLATAPQSAPDTTVSNNVVTSTGGTMTLCDNYGQPQGSEQDGNSANTARAPEPGMAVFDEMNGVVGTFLGNVAATPAPTQHSFALDGSAGTINISSPTRIAMSAYGGCGIADYWRGGPVGGGNSSDPGTWTGGPGGNSGKPEANYWDNCIWGSRNVTVSANTFVLETGKITGCLIAANMCGYMADEAFNAGVPPLWVFWDSYTNLIAKASGGLNNVWSDNTYTVSAGATTGWQFWARSQGDQVTPTAWRDAYGQDAGSTFNTGTAPAASTTLPATVASSPSTAAASAATSQASSVSSSSPVSGGGTPGQSSGGSPSSGSGGQQSAGTSVPSQPAGTTAAPPPANSPTPIPAPAPGTGPTTPATETTTPAGGTTAPANGATTQATGTTTTPATGATGPSTGTTAPATGPTAPAASSASTVPAAEPTGQDVASVTVTVRNGKGDPVERARITVDGRYSAYTDSQGRARFRGLGGGTHHVTASGPGSGTGQKTFTLVGHTSKDVPLTVASGPSRTFVVFLAVLISVALVLLGTAGFAYVRMRRAGRRRKATRSPTWRMS